MPTIYKIKRLVAQAVAVLAATLRTQVQIPRTLKNKKKVQYLTLSLYDRLVFCIKY